MKKIIVFGFSLFLFFSCGNSKKIQEQINIGNYDAAIDLSVEKIKNNKNDKSTDDYKILLKNAYDKAMKKDKELVYKLKQEVSRNPEKWQDIYQTYLGMDARESKIKNLLPLRLVKKGNNINFNFKNYNKKIIEARSNLVNYLYNNAKNLYYSSDKKKIRKAYNLFDELDRISPNYKDVRKLMDKTHQKGISHIFVNIENKTNKKIPKEVYNELLDFTSYGAGNFWTDYHNKPVNNISYDYKIKFIFNNIEIGKNQKVDKEEIQEANIQDGYIYKKDANGKIIKDQNGNPIKVPRIKKIRSKIHLYQQHKEAVVGAKVDIIKVLSGQNIKSYPLKSKSAFNYYYATQQGDPRALKKEYRELLDKKPIKYPTDAEMIHYTSQDLKMKFKDILSKADFMQ